MDKGGCFLRRKIVELKPLAAEAIAPAATCHRQSHGGAGHGWIGVSDQPFDEAQIAGATCVTPRRPDRLLVGAAEEKADQRRSIQSPASPQARNEIFTILLGLRQIIMRKAKADLVGDLFDEPDEHGGHQRTFLFGQARFIVEEQIAPDDRQPIAAGDARALDGLVRSPGGSNRPFDRQHPPIMDGLR